MPKQTLIICHTARRLPVLGREAKLTESNSLQGNSGSWRYLGQQLISRTLDPATNVSFVIFVILGPFIFGALGVWVEVGKRITSATPLDYSSLIIAISTFYPALGCSTALQLVLASASKYDKIFISFALLMFCTFLATAMSLQFFIQIHPKRVLEISCICSVAAIWLWWITNGSDPIYKPTSTDAATGGQLNRNLPGNLTGFQV